MLQLENYWWGFSVYKIEEHLNLTIPFTQNRSADYYSLVDEGRLSFNPKHIQAVDGILQEANIDVNGFSAIQWNTDGGDGMEYIDYNNCAKTL